MVIWCCWHQPISARCIHFCVYSMHVTLSSQSAEGLWKGLYHFNSFHTDPALPGNGPLKNTCTKTGYQSYYDSCYKLDTTPRTYDAAISNCAIDGAFLASIPDGYDEAFIETEILKNGFSAAWIGLKQDPVSNFDIKVYWQIFILFFAQNLLVFSCQKKVMFFLWHTYNLGQK